MRAQIAALHGRLADRTFDDYAGHDEGTGRAGYWSGWRTCSHPSWTGARTQSGHVLVAVTSGRQAWGHTELTGVVGGATLYLGCGESSTRCY
jgi:hypothetical protein